MLPWLAAVPALFGLACSDLLTPRAAPDSARLDAVAAVVEEAGCLRLEVRLSGPERIDVLPADTITCGPVQPVVAGAPSFDGRVVRLPIALLNRGERRLKAPARLYGWEDSLVVLSPPGLARNKHAATYLDFLAADSVMADAATTLAGARVWRYDARLAPAEPQCLAAGDTSEVRWVEVRVHPGVQRFRVSLYARARRGSAPVPAQAPDSVPGWVYDQAYWGQDVPGSTEWFTKGLVRVVFHEHATHLERQEAIDLVDAEVIGGDPEVAEYFIRVDGAATRDALEALVDALLTLPQVFAASVQLHGGGGHDYLTPKDGPGFEAWKLTPEQADGLNRHLEAVNAPLAWGCDTGVNRPLIGVVEGPRCERSLGATYSPTAIPIARAGM